VSPRETRLDLQALSRLVSADGSVVEREGFNFCSLPVIQRNQ